MVVNGDFDSLRQDLRGVHRVDALNLMAWEKRSEDSKFAEDLTDYLLDRLEKRPYALGEAEALVTKALLLWQSGNPQDGLVKAMRAHHLLQRLENPFLLGRCCTVLGLVQWNLGQLEEAWDYWRKSYFIYKEMEYPSGMANSLTNFANLLYEDGQDALAAEYYREALDLMRVDSNEMGIGNLLNNLGYIALTQKAFMEARKYFHKAVRTMKRIRNYAALASIYENLAQLHLDKDQPEAARPYLKLMARYRYKAGLGGTEDVDSIQSMRYYAHPASKEHDPRRARQAGLKIMDSTLRDMDRKMLLETIVRLCEHEGHLDEALQYSRQLASHWESRCNSSSRFLLKRANMAFRLSRSGKEPVERGFMSKDPRHILSIREYEVFVCIGRGMISKEIGEELNISPQTVQVHRRQIARKLGTRGTDLSVTAVKYHNSLRFLADQSNVSLANQAKVSKRGNGTSPGRADPN